MDALQNDHHVRRRHEELRIVKALMFHEIEPAPMERLACEDLQEILRETDAVHGLEMLVVEIALGVARIAGIPHEVVVGGDAERGATVRLERTAETDRGGRLTGGGRPRLQHETHGRYARGDQLGDARESLGVMLLALRHEQGHIAGRQQLVQFRDGTDMEIFLYHDVNSSDVLLPPSNAGWRWAQTA